MLEKLVSISMITLGITGICLHAYVLLTEDDVKPQEQNRVDVHERVVVINGDTAKKIYVLQDSMNGMTWIGIPGTNRLK
jgi:hypothetical protein